MVRRFPPFVVALAALLATACQVDVDVTVTVEDDATGQVAVDLVLDEAASARVPDLGQMLETDDLTAAGWTIGPVEATPTNGQSISATKPFGSPAELQLVLDEIAGPESIVRDLAVFRNRPFGTIELGFRGVLDPSGGLEQFGDEDLTTALGGFPLGIDLAELEAELGADPASMVTVELEAVLAGRQDPDPAVWSIRLDETEPVPFAASSTMELEEPRRWVRYALVAAVGFVVVVLLELLLVRNRRRRGQNRPEQ
ncbi:MAG: hypothetical protein ACERLM_03215 [Acidimicrobiales bacterium]